MHATDAQLTDFLRLLLFQMQQLGKLYDVPSTTEASQWL